MAAFDALARDYDAQFSQSVIACWLRARVHDRLNEHFPPGSHVLELGGGTGEDALRLARRGVRVVATDASAAMLEIAAAKTAAEPNIILASLDMTSLPAEPSRLLDGPFDGVFANFGPLNCLGNWRELAGWLAARVRPGGVAAFGIMSRYCLWEMGWHALHGDIATATRRLRGRADFNGLTIYYPSPGRLSRDFAPEFARITVTPLGIALPPSDGYGVVEHRPRLLRTLLRAERVLGRFGGLAQFADHYWLELRRTA